MKTTHTPGPWKPLRTLDHPGGYSLINIAGSDGSAVAISRTWLARPDVATLEANAKLIAAAPDLLAALERWEKFARDNLWTDEDCTFLAATRAAIAKT